MSLFSGILLPVPWYHMPREGDQRTSLPSAYPNGSADDSCSRALVPLW